MKKYNAIYKRGNVEKVVVIEFHNIDLFVVIDEKGSKEVKRDTVRRWYTIGSEIIEKDLEKKEEKAAAEKKDRKHSRSEVKKDGSVRQDKFKPKLNADQAYEILTAYHKGSKKAHLAREYQVSFRTVTCIVEGLMWKEVFAKFHAAS